MPKSFSEKLYNLIRLTDPAGLAYANDYDAKGNLVYSTDPLGNLTRFAYSSAFNRLSTLIDAKGNVTKYGYDTAGNLTSITYDDGSVERWSYDPSGLPDGWTNRRAQAVDYEYDANGRLTAKVYPDASRVDYVYDARGNLVSVTDPNGTTTLEYYPDDRLKKITYPGDRFLEYTYNAAGQRASSTNQLGHRLDYHYDAAGRLETLTDETAATIVQYHYDAAGRLERKDLGNGVYTLYQYDTAGQLTSLINYKPDDSVLSQFIYTYDSRGRRTSMTTLEGRWDYEYDDLGQLTAWTAPDGRHVEYVYDALGNRITVTDDGVVTPYATNNLNQYTQVGDTTYQFDADGNLIGKIAPEGTTTYTFDEENRLVAVNSPTGNWGYTYDGFASRVRVDDNGGVTDFVVDPIGFGDVVGEYDHGSEALIAQYDHGIGLVARENAGSSAGFYTFDAIGNTAEVTGSVGTVLNSYAYLLFGQLLAKTETVENPFEFVGEYGVTNLAPELSFMRARYYDASLGKFYSTDPKALSGRDVNLYRYVENMPTKFVDPSGLSVKDFVCAGLGLIDRLGVICATDVIVTYPDEFRRGLNYFRDPLERYDNCELYGTCSDDSNNEPSGSTGEDSGDRSNGPRIPPISAPVPSPLDAGGGGSSQTAASGDPNAKTGPTGRGAARYIPGDSLLPYRVDFENDASATAPAQIVTITDPLDADLDRSTFELTEIGFGDTRIAIPQNTQHYEATVPMSYNGTDFDVQIEAGIHLAAGEVYVNFFSIDPYTGLPPSVGVGFLPPEDGTGRGDGYFAYTMKPKTGLAAGTEIRNVAYITFDYQETIATNQVDPHDPSQGTNPNKEALNTIAPAEATLTVDSTEGGSVTEPGEGTFTYPWGETVDLTAVPAPSMSFVNWTGDVDTVADVDSPDTTVTLYDDFSVTGNFSTNAPDSCTDPDTVIQNVTYTPTTHYCAADNSITAGPAVTVVKGADVTYLAPVVRLRSGFQVNTGGLFRIQTPESPPTTGESIDAAVAGAATRSNVTARMAPEALHVRHLSRSALPAGLDAALVAYGVDLEALRDFITDAEGRLIVFTSDQDILRNDHNQLSDIYAYQVPEDRLWLISHTPQARSGNGASSYPAMDAYGERIVFQSEASDLTADDDNAVRDVFLFDTRYWALENMTATANQGATPVAPASHPALDAEGYQLLYDQAGSSGRRRVHAYDYETGWLEQVDDPDQEGLRLASISTLLGSPNSRLAYYGNE